MKRANSLYHSAYDYYSDMKSSKVRHWFLFVQGCIIAAYAVEYYNQHRALVAERNAAQPPARECYEMLSEQEGDGRGGQRYTSYVGLLRFQMKMEAYERCKKEIAKYSLLQYQSVLPNPLWVLSQLLSSVFIAPIHSILEMLSNLVQGLFEKLDFIDKFLITGAVTLIVLAPIYFYFNRKRRTPKMVPSAPRYNYPFFEPPSPLIRGTRTCDKASFGVPILPLEDDQNLLSDCSIAASSRC